MTGQGTKIYSPSSPEISEDVSFRQGRLSGEAEPPITAELAELKVAVVGYLLLPKKVRGTIDTCWGWEALPGNRGRTR